MAPTIPIAELETTVGVVAREIVGEMLMVEQTAGERGLAMVAPTLLEIMGQVAVVANHHEPVLADDVGAMMLDTSAKVKAWLTDGTEPDLSTLPVSDHPLAGLRITLPEIADRVVTTVTKTAVEAAGNDPSSSGMVRGLLMGAVTRERSIHMVGALVAGIRNEPVEPKEVEDFFAEIAKGIQEKVFAEISRTSQIEGYA